MSQAEHTYVETNSLFWQQHAPEVSVVLLRNTVLLW